MRVIWKRPAARRCEFGREGLARGNWRHDLVADATKAGDAVGETFDLQAVPVHAARLSEIVFYENAHRLAALQLEHRSGNVDGVLGRDDRVFLEQETVRGLSADESIWTLL